MVFWVTLWQTYSVSSQFISQSSLKRNEIAYLWHFFFFFLPKITRLPHHGTQAVEHQPIESVTVDNDAHFKTHDKTKQNQHAESQPPIEIVQCQMNTASAALAIQITSLLCFALGCGREKNLDNGFHLPPSQTNHTSIGSTHCSGWRIGNTAAQHCRWHWSRSMLLHLPVFLCQCQFFATQPWGRREYWQIRGSTWDKKTSHIQSTATSEHLEMFLDANLCKLITRGQMRKHGTDAPCVHHIRINRFIGEGCVVRMHTLHAYFGPCTDQISRVSRVMW